MKRNEDGMKRNDDGMERNDDGMERNDDGMGIYFLTINYHFHLSFYLPTPVS